MLSAEPATTRTTGIDTYPGLCIGCC